MGIERATAWPSRYVTPDQIVEEEQFELSPPAGTVLLRLEVKGQFVQKQLAERISRELHEKSRFDRKERFYTWSDLTLSCNVIYCGPLPIAEICRLAPVFDALAGYTADSLTVTYYAEQQDLHLLANLVNILESRFTLIRQALALEDELQLILNDGFALGITLSAFSYNKVEAVAYLMAQACVFAASTGKARMKPVDGSNPKFQMRSWLLRLGFIGPAFERPRKTLLEALDGDSAFFSEDQKKTQIARRRARSMNTYA